MIGILVKSGLVIGLGTGVALLSTQWSQTVTSPNKVSFNNEGKTIKDVTRIEEIDAWGKENGCNFSFVKDWDKKEVYTATEYAKAYGGKESNVGALFEHISLENAIVKAVNKHKNYCGDKLKAFTFLWHPEKWDFYIGDPNEKPKESSAIKSFVNRLWNNLFCFKPRRC